MQARASAFQQQAWSHLPKRSSDPCNQLWPTCCQQRNLVAFMWPASDLRRLKKHGSKEPRSHCASSTRSPVPDRLEPDYSPRKHSAHMHLAPHAEDLAHAPRSSGTDNGQLLKASSKASLEDIRALLRRHLGQAVLGLGVLSQDTSRKRAPGVFHGSFQPALWRL